MNRPRLLVSVRSAEEAIDASAADFLDVKEPAAGPLGAAAASTAEAVCHAASAAQQVTAAAGELIDWPKSRSRELLDVAGVSAIKLGLAGCREVPSWRTLWRAAQQEASRVGKHLVAACYADSSAAGAPSPEDVVELAIEAECLYFLLDTWDKTQGALLHHIAASRLAKLLADARRGGVATVVAGSLRQSSLAQLPLEQVDVIAVRGAVCQGSRESRICPQRVDNLKAALRAAAANIGLAPALATRHNDTD